MPTGRPVLRSYQERATRLVREAWAAGKRRVCLVAPPGSGKTVMGAALCDARVVWVAHRTELVTQAAAALEALGLDVGIVMADVPRRAAPVQVGTIQTLMARSVRPEAGLVVFDEFHHYAPGSEDWSTFAAHYADARILGLTATPERADGSGLGNVADHLVVAATYSELREAGHLVDCLVWAPPSDTVTSGWALDPLDAYQRHAEGSRAFLFMDRVERADDYALRFCTAGIPARAIKGTTPKGDRGLYLSQFAESTVRVITNVATMTEGVDVPAARTCVLASGCSHPSIYLQKVGRVLRPHPDKPHAILLDLVDATAQHGLPTEDRNYSLTDGQAITRVASGCRICPQCYRTFETGKPACPECGWVIPKVKPPTVKIWNAELRRVYAGAETPAAAKDSELTRLLSVARSKGWALSWVVTEYKKLFGVAPPFSEPEQREYFAGLVAFGRKRGFKPGFAGAVFHETFGRWPSKHWREQGGVGV